MAPMNKDEKDHCELMGRAVHEIKISIARIEEKIEPLVWRARLGERVLMVSVGGGLIGLVFFLAQRALTS